MEGNEYILGLRHILLSFSPFWYTSTTNNTIHFPSVVTASPLPILILILYLFRTEITLYLILLIKYCIIQQSNWAFLFLLY